MNHPHFASASPRQAQRGFTIYELLIVVAIIGIIASIGYPSYRQHVVKNNRAAAEAFMLMVANQEEQVLLDQRSYGNVASNANFPNAPGGASPGLNLNVPTNVSNYYNLSVVAVAGSPPAYAITATPVGSQLSEDTKCGVIGISQTGNKGGICTVTVATAALSCTVPATTCW